MVIERAIADFFTLLIGKLTKWNAPGQGGGDPVYLTPEQSAELAVAGIRMLTPLLPAEEAKKIEAVVEKHPRREHVSVEEALVTVGSLGGIIHHGNSGPPGCCVWMNGHLVCTRLATSSR
jgi:hypothetical protein